MFALTGTWGLLRALGVRATRALAAVEPRTLNRHAQRNAASAAALARAQLLEVEDADLAVAACLAQMQDRAAASGLLAAERVAR